MKNIYNCDQGLMTPNPKPPLSQNPLVNYALLGSSDRWAFLGDIIHFGQKQEFIRYCGLSQINIYCIADVELPSGVCFLLLSVSFPYHFALASWLVLVLAVWLALVCSLDGLACCLQIAISYVLLCFLLVFFDVPRASAACRQGPGEARSTNSMDATETSTRGGKPCYDAWRQGW